MVPEAFTAKDLATIAAHLNTRLYEDITEEGLVAASMQSKELQKLMTKEIVTMMRAIMRDRDTLAS